ncbi:protein timeless-like [Leptidea sinapis]|uniref:protein timeless-like n=1 Tax=Leptidea sinapis TaxID=189913 RepID=UPI002126E094|nr:protein timeless-like [Leptidea sinapis]
MVQLIALLYKDQHVTVLQKLLNSWLESSHFDSSEDNESNTSQHSRGSSDLPMLSSGPTSDCSDNEGSAKMKGQSDSPTNSWDSVIRSTNNDTEKLYKSNNTMKPKPFNKSVSAMDISLSFDENQSDNITYGTIEELNIESQRNPKRKMLTSENWHCAYGSEDKNKELVSTSSNDDEPYKKPVHQKPYNPKQRPNTKLRIGLTESLQTRRRKKVMKRATSNIINVRGLSHSTPTNDDIACVMKEFTVDFLLKGYNALVKTLHTQILTNFQLEIDISHFFWLVTYFLKFATQIELDLSIICSVISFDMVLYLTAEGVHLCEQFELAIKLKKNDLKPIKRRLHLVVAAIREFVQAIHVYKKSDNIREEDRMSLLKLQVKMCETEELRSLLVLLLRHYNPNYHTKQYLQDLVITNHILLLLLDNVMKVSDYKGTGTMADHLMQFATPEIMFQYGLLLEDYESNGEFVNDCIFTLMHHVGGDLGCLISLFQPNILKTFTAIFESEYKICEEWSDLIQYSINTFVKKPLSSKRAASFRMLTGCVDDDIIVKDVSEDGKEKENTSKKDFNVESVPDGWTNRELESFNWKYLQSTNSSDIVGEILRLLKEDGIVKSRESVIKQLLTHAKLDKTKFGKLTKDESGQCCKVMDTTDTEDDNVGKLCEQLKQNGKAKSLAWVQSILLETCFAKIYLETVQVEDICRETDTVSADESSDKKPKELPILSPTSYNCLMLNKSVPLVPWNGEQAAICKDVKFLQLLYQLGFYMPGETGKIFIRIPYVWTPETLYEVANQLSPIDISKLKFPVSDISAKSVNSREARETNTLKSGQKNDISMSLRPDNFFQIQKQKHLAAVVNFTPMQIPGSSCDSPSNERSSSSWLQVVQKAQELNLPLEIERTEAVPSCSKSESIENRVILLDGAKFLMPTALTVKPHQTSGFNISQADSECCNTLCETTSVASGLTRMYVSDEE